MSITYRHRGVNMPNIKRQATSQWIKSIASSYRKKSMVKSLIFSVLTKKYLKLTGNI